MHTVQPASKSIPRSAKPTVTPTSNDLNGDRKGSYIESSRGFGGDMTFIVVENHKCTTWLCFASSSISLRVDVLFFQFCCNAPSTTVDGTAIQVGWSGRPLYGRYGRVRSTWYLSCDYFVVTWRCNPQKVLRSFVVYSTRMCRPRSVWNSLRATRHPTVVGLTCPN